MKLPIAVEFPHLPVYGAENQNTESKREDKQHLPVFLPSLNNVICITHSTFHLICLGLGNAIHMKSKQIITSKERADILGCFIFIYILYIIYYTSFIYFYLSLACLHIPKFFFQWFCFFHLSNFASLPPLPPAALL